MRSDIFLISFDCNHDEDKAILIVGRKLYDESIEIINAFQGEEALELYKKLSCNISTTDHNPIIFNHNVDL